MDLSQFGRKSFISQRALEEVLTVCKNHPDELARTGTSRASIKRSRETAFDATTPYGKLLQQFALVGENGEAISVDFISPQAMLRQACSESPKFATAVQQMLVKEKPTIQKPLTVCLYADEISPGNNLKRDNRRRVQALYWSLRQLGPMKLAMESSWFFLSLMRSETVSKVKNGMSQVARECLKIFYKQGVDFRQGIQLPFPDAVYMSLPASVGHIVADESALKQFFENKGAGGKLLCLFCQNCVSRRYAPENTEGLVLHDSLEFWQLKLHTDRSIFQFVNHLKEQAGTSTKKELEELETNLGFNHCPQGLLQDEFVQTVLKPIASVAFDPMRIYLVSGLFQVEVTFLLENLSTARVKQPEIHRFLQSTAWRFAVGSSGNSITSAFGKKFDDGFKCTGSEALALYPCLRLFLQLLPRERVRHIQPCITSYLNLADVLDSLRPAAAGLLEGQALLQRIRRHLLSFKVACLIWHVCTV